MNKLFLADLEEYTEEEVIHHLINEYQALPEEVNLYEVIIAYESVGSWGCDSSSFFLLRHKESGELFEVHGGHCSCFGFEGQFKPEKTSELYLKSEHFNFSCGGYDEGDISNKKLVRDFISANF